MNRVDAEGTTSQSPSRKRIRSDSDAYEEELIELYSRKGSSSSLSSRTQVAEEMKNRKELYHECSVPIAYAGFRANRKQGDSKEYGQRQIYVHGRRSKMIGKRYKRIVPRPEAKQQEKAAGGRATHSSFYS